MAKTSQEKPALFGKPKMFPRPLDPDQISARIEEANRLMQEVEGSYVGLKRIEVPVLSTRPFDFILWGDLHLLSLSTDAAEIDRTIAKILANPFAMVFLMGDEIEGIKREYERTNRSIATYMQQEDLLVYKLMPLAESGQLKGFLRDYWGHPGWSDTGRNSDPWLRFSREWGVPQLMTGGEFVLRWEDGVTWKTMLWHNPPGGSKVDPVKGLREVSLTTDISARMRLYASAHLHREGIASELQPGDETQRYFIAVGTQKGSNPDFPSDGFGVRLGKGNLPTSRAGQGLVIYRTDSDRNSGVRGVPFSSLDQGGVLGQALRIADHAVSNNIDEELVGRVLSKKKKPELKILNGSLVSTSPYFEESDVARDRDEEEDEERIPEAEYSAAHDLSIIPPYEKLRLKPKDATSPLAVMVHSNIRAGSSSEGLEPLREFRSKNVVNNPLVLELWCRNFLDKDAGMRPNREETLEELVDILRDSDGRGIGLLLDASMRRKSWLRKVGRSEGIIPATYLAENAGVPLLQNQSLVEIIFGSDLVYPIGVVDKLMNSGSLSNSAFGLLQMYTKHMGTKPAVLVGGHMPSAGWTSWEDRGNKYTDYPVVIQPGSYAKTFDGLGGGNRSKGAKPGQGFFMMPGKRQTDAWIVPFGDESSFNDLFTALLLFDEVVRKDTFPKLRRELEKMGIIAKR